MPTIPVMMGLMDPLYNLFGWILSTMYQWLESYGLVIIVFTILINVILLPFGVKAQKGMLKQQGLQDEMNEIKRQFPDDMETQQRLQQELFRKNGVSLTSGCLPSLLRLVLIIPVFRIFQQPLHYIGGVSAENISKISEYLANNNLLSEQSMRLVGRSDIQIISALQENASALGTAVESGWIKLNQLIDLKFLGLNLGRTPAWKPAVLFGPESNVYLPLLILPILTIVLMLIQMRLTTKTAQAKVVDKAEIERAKRNPAKQEQMPTDNNAGMFKGMNTFMVFMMVWTVFALPSAMGVYWVMNSVMSIAQSLFIYQFYTKPFRKSIEENS